MTRKYNKITMHNENSHVLKQIVHVFYYYKIYLIITYLDSKLFLTIYFFLIF